MSEDFKLGFGMMRLPKRGVVIDVEHSKKMVDAFIAAGGDYFDTAYVYLGSEVATRKALVERYPRKSFRLASKLNVSIAPTEKFAKAELAKSLERTGTDHFDYYLLHCIQENNYKKFETFHLWDFVKEQKAKGVIKHIAFSYHSGPELLDRLLTEHPEVEMVQLQINYADWENPSVTSRANYEVARKHGKDIVIMEPVKGGKLANPPEDVKRLLTAHHPDMSCASWAIRFAASLDGVITVLSGMSNMDQMLDNLNYMRDFCPLDGEERKIIYEAQRLLKKSATVPCTACRYCVEGCPKQIPIPEIFEAMNLQLGSGQTAEAKAAYGKFAVGHRASDCISCRRCESVCPQHIKISDNMKQCIKMLEQEK